VKTISAADERFDVERLLNAAQSEQVLVTRAGKPSAVIIGLESYDEEDLQLASSSAFWKMIEDRRSGPSIPLAEIKARLAPRRPRNSSRLGRLTRRRRRKPGS